MTKMWMIAGVLAVMLLAAGCKCACKETASCPTVPPVAHAAQAVAP